VDFLGLRHIVVNWQLVGSVLSIVFINIVLSGDNAVVIAMAVRSLDKRERRTGIAFGSAVAVILRVVLTFCAAWLLTIDYVKLAGGALILWIAVRLLLQGSPEEKGASDAASLWHAIWIILVADFTMSLDNVLAIAGACAGNLLLLVFGLLLSIPIVVFSSNLLSTLMDKFSVIIYLGAAVLGRVGGEMMLTDPVIVRLFHPPEVFQYALEGVLAVGVIVAANIWSKRRPVNRQPEPPLDQEGRLLPTHRLRTPARDAIPLKSEG
jgi:YjbE family integral membrane protein